MVMNGIRLQAGSSFAVLGIHPARLAAINKRTCRDLFDPMRAVAPRGGDAIFDAARFNAPIEWPSADWP